MKRTVSKAWFIIYILQNLQSGFYLYILGRGRAVLIFSVSKIFVLSEFYKATHKLVEWVECFIQVYRLEEPPRRKLSDCTVLSSAPVESHFFRCYSDQGATPWGLSVTPFLAFGQVWGTMVPHNRKLDSKADPFTVCQFNRQEQGCRKTNKNKPENIDFDPETQCLI